MGVLGTTAQGPVNRKPLGMVPPRVEGLPGHPQFGPGRGVGRRILPGVVEATEGGLQPVEVHRAPVVRVHQRRLAQLAALVHVRHAGHRDLHELLRQ